MEWDGVVFGVVESWPRHGRQDVEMQTEKVEFRHSCRITNALDVHRTTSTIWRLGVDADAVTSLSHHVPLQSSNCTEESGPFCSQRISSTSGIFLTISSLSNMANDPKLNISHNPKPSLALPATGLVVRFPYRALKSIHSWGQNLTHEIPYLPSAVLLF